MSDTTIDSLLAERDWLARLARRLVDDDATAADLAQDTWVTALSRPPAHTRGLRAWLATVLRHRALDRHRRDRSETRRTERSRPPEPSADPAGVVARAEIEHRVADLVLGLPALYRDVLLLRYYEGLSPTEIAGSTGTPPGTVRSRLQRGRDLMRERLDERHDGDRRTWMVALIPLAKRATPERTVMLTLPLKIALGVAVLLAGGTAALFAVPSAPSEPPPEKTTEAPVGETASEATKERPAVTGEQSPTSDPQPPEEMPRKDSADVLEEEVPVDFVDAPLRSVLDFLVDATGSRVRFEVAEEVGKRTITIRADGISVRSLLDLITIPSRLRWKRRADGSVLISNEVPKETPPKAKAPRSWFGSRQGSFDPPSPDAAEPQVRLVQSDMAERMPTGAANIHVQVGADGTCWTGQPATPGRFGLWLALQLTPDATVLLHAHAECPADAFLAAWRVGGGRERWLVTGDTTGLRLPRRPPAEKAPIRLFARHRPGEGTDGQKLLYEDLYRIRTANPNTLIDLHLRLVPGSRTRDLVVLLGEARRFGLVVREVAVSALRPTKTATAREFVLDRYPADTAISNAPVPPLREGVSVSAGPRLEAPAPQKYRGMMVSGRAGRRNLRANGGGATTVAAVDGALHWLVARQAKNGSWGDDRGDTAAVLLALLADPGGREGEQYSESIRRGLTWLTEAEDDRGDVALAFAEAWALTGDPIWKDAAQSALERTRSSAARRLARCCGIDSPRLDADAPGSTPLACLGRILDGEVPWTSESLARAMNAFLEPVRDNPGALRGLSPSFLHDATLPAYQAGGGAWIAWLKAIKQELLPTQITSGADAGSWPPPEGMSRIRATALNAATLSVFYRYPRLFRRAK